MGTTSDQPLERFGAVGELRTCALIEEGGGLGFLCLPRFDSPACFAGLLDGERGGRFDLAPVAAGPTRFGYLPDTNVLEHRFEVDGGRARLLDFMPVGDGWKSRPVLLRVVEGLSGAVRFRAAARPAPGFGLRSARLVGHGTVLEARAAGAPAVFVLGPRAWRVGPGGAEQEVEVTPGERVAFALSLEADAAAEACSRAVELAAATAEFWRAWVARCNYEGPYRQAVRRSALAVKLACYEPAGSVVAAPTTSLPERIGGTRNWDYRFAWLRDASFTVEALDTIGFEAESRAFVRWIADRCLALGEPQILYRVDGSIEGLEERELPLAGWRGSRPVRVGNAAAHQEQLDVYGEVLDSLFLYLERGGSLDETLRRAVDELAREVCRHWREPDRGIWEVRGAPRHFVHSKVMCWAALDRALAISERHGGRTGNSTRWAAERDRIRAEIFARGIDPQTGAFVGAYGDAVLDASALRYPSVGFVPDDHPAMLATAREIQQQLMRGCFVRRYAPERWPDGLEGGEGAFVPCSFWLADLLARQGNEDRAREIFEGVLKHASPLGLLSEEVDPEKGELLGNYPQTLSHIALIRAALAIAEGLRPAAARAPAGQTRGRSEAAPASR